MINANYRSYYNNVNKLLYFTYERDKLKLNLNIKNYLIVHKRITKKLSFLAPVPSLVTHKLTTVPS